MHRYRKANPVISWILSVVLILGVLPVSVSAASSKEIQKEINGLKSKKAELQKEIDAMKEKEERLKRLQKFTFKDFLNDNGLSSIEDVVIQYKGIEYMLKPAMPMLFDVEMKKGTSGKVYMISEGQKLDMNLKDIAELIKEESAFVGVKK